MRNMLADFWVVHTMRWWLSVWVVMSLMLAGCGGGGSEDRAQQVSISTSASTLTADGVSYANVTVTVVDKAGAPLPAARVSLSTTFGTLSRTTDDTDRFGQVTVRLTAPTSPGAATVTATVNGYYASTVVQFSAAAPGSVGIYASPANIQPNASTTLTAVVLDNLGNGVPNMPLVFSYVGNPASGGVLGATAATTDVNGRATVAYQAGVRSGMDWLQVSTNNGRTAQVGVNVSTSGVFLADLSVTAANASAPADGVTTTAVTAQVVDDQGVGVEGVVVSFASSAGRLSVASASTNAQGYAQVMLTSPSTTGTAVVSAAAGGMYRTTTVDFVSSSTGSQSVTFTGSAATAAPNSPVTLTVQVVDAAGNAVVGETVSFSATTNVSGGGFSAGAAATVTAVTDTFGRASVVYTTGVQAGTDVLTARTSAGVSRTFSLVVSNASVAVGDMLVSVGGADVPANGTQVAVTATLTGTTGAPLSGVSVGFSSTLGALSAATATTNAQGVASVMLSSTTPGTATITASAGGVVRTASVNFTGGSVSAVALTANPSSLVSGAVSSVVARVTDSGGRPIVGESLTFGFAANASGALFVSTPTATTGSSTQSATTDAFGRATVYYKAGSTSGSDTVEVISSNGVHQSVVITVAGSGATIGGLTLTSANASIPADGVTTVALTAQVQDTAGQPLANQSVAFASTAGTLSAATATTDATGMARVTLRAGTQATTAVVTASTGGFNATVSVQLVAGVPSAANSAITAQPASLPADGVSTSTVTVVLRDANNNPVANGTPVTLLTTAGTITSANPATTSLGRATFTLQAPAAPGSASLTLLEYPSVSAAAVTFGSVSTGDPANITVSVANPALFVTGVGKTDSTSMVVTVKDAAGALISDANAGVNNLVVTFRSKPNGGETISGTNAAGTVVTSSTSIAVRTSNGVATLTLQAGTLPGVVELEVEALSSAGAALVPAVKASLPQVSIASGPPHNIALSYPVAGVTNLGGGVYRRIGSASVTDRYGNAVPDGTVISLGLLDSVIASNTTPVLSGGAASDASTTAGSATLTEVDSTWTSASVTRNGVARSLQANDRVLLLNAVAGDKSRFLTVAPAANTSATVQKNYSTTAAGLEYVMGAALLGGQISGVDAQTGLTQTGRATTQNGVATLYVTYPADREHILTGCYGLASAANHTLDIRTGNAPAGSAQVWVVAESTESGATSLDNRFCFAAIGPYKLPSGAGGTISGTTTITFDVKDQNDIPLPFVQVSPSAAVTTNTGAPLTVSFGNCSGRADQRTDAFGVCSMTITVGGADSGDAATITIGAGDATPISITLTVP